MCGLRKAGELVGIFDGTRRLVPFVYHHFPSEGLVLTDLQLKNLPHLNKAYKESDGGGLFVLVHHNGAKYWRFSYRYGDKQKTLALGVYPEVSIKEARQRLANAKELLAQGCDPSQQRKLNKLTTILKSENTVRVVALEWLDNQASKLAAITHNKIKRAFENYLFPSLGALPIADVTAIHLLAALRKLEAQGKYETAHRLRAWSGAVFRHAILTERCDRNPAVDLRGDALKAVKSQRRRALLVSQLPVFLRKLNDPSVRIEFRTRLALRLLLQTFVRPGELRGAAWDEFDFDKAEWRIPAHRMKMKEEHIVPLSVEAVATLRALQEISGYGVLVFPCVGKPNKPMSENTLCKAIQEYLGFPVTAAGFRATATSALLELGWPAHVLDRQLAHRERKQVFGAYSHMAQYMPERRAMMSAWGAHLEVLEHGALVVPLMQRVA